MRHYLFIDAVTQADAISARRASYKGGRTGVCADQAGNRQAFTRGDPCGQMQIMTEQKRAIQMCFYVASCRAAAYLCCCATSWLHLFGPSLCV